MFERLKGKRGLVMGLGTFGGGSEAAKFLHRHGASVLVTDLRSQEVLKESVAELAGMPVEYRLGEHREADFAQAGVIIHSPAVRPDHPLLLAARARGAEVTMEMSLFIEACRGKTVGITGSNGKTTTAILCYEMLCEVMQRAQPELEGRWAEKTGTGRGVMKMVGEGGPKLIEQAAPSRVWLGGNIGEPLINRVEEIGESDVVVLELSSFQLMDWHRIKRSCNVALITNITPNHLDWHRGIDEYIRAKCAIFEYQPVGGRCVILNLDDKRDRDLLELHPKLKSDRKDKWRAPMLAPKPTDPKPLAKGKDGPRIASLAMAMGRDETENPEDAIIGYSVDPTSQRGAMLPALTRSVFAGGHFTKPDGKEIEADPETLTEWRRGFAFVGALQRDNLKAPGLFNWSNAAGAWCAATAAVNDMARTPMIGRALTRFRGVEHRLEFCGEVNGARCFNDSIATTPESTIAALSAFESGIHLLLGGSDKGLSYDELAKAIAAHKGIRGLYVQGVSGPAVTKALAQAGASKPQQFPGFDSACDAVFAALQPGEVFLMSPASASFYEYAPNNRFTNFEHRGRHFKELVKAHASKT